MRELVHFPWEFGAETLWIWSTHEVNKTTKFQLQSPLGSVPTRTWLFSHPPFFFYKMWSRRHIDTIGFDQFGWNFNIRARALRLSLTERILDQSAGCPDKGGVNRDVYHGYTTSGGGTQHTSWLTDWPIDLHYEMIFHPFNITQARIRDLHFGSKTLPRRKASSKAENRYDIPTRCASPLGALPAFISRRAQLKTPDQKVRICLFVRIHFGAVGREI